MKFFNWKKKPHYIGTVQPTDDNYAVVIQKAERDAISANSLKAESLSKSYHKKDIAYASQIKALGSLDFGEGYVPKYTKTDMKNDLRVVLRKSANNIMINSIIVLRGNQAAAFAMPARLKDDGIGFEVHLKDRSATPNKNDIKRMHDIEDFIWNAGDKQDPSYNFRTWIRQTIRDTFIYDQANSELTYKGGSGSQLLKFRAIDAGSVFFAADPKTGMPASDKTNDTYFVQLEDQRIVSEFKQDELTFNSMNPRTDVRHFRYGLSPVETSLNEIQYFEMTETFNAKYFSQGGTTMGALMIKAGADQQSETSLEEFRRDMSSRFSGTQGSWKIPVFSADDAKYINMNQSSRDMEFEKWLNFLINVISSNFGVDPQEINFPNRGGATGSKGNSLQEASKKEGAQLSQAKGLDPLLSFIEDIINTNIIPKLDDRYIFSFKGDSISRDIQLLEKTKAEVSVKKTLNEVRQEDNLPEIPGGDIPLNAVIVQRLGQIQQQKMLEQQQQQATTDDVDNATNNMADTGAEVAQGMDGTETAAVKNDVVGKDGQVKSETNMNAAKQGGKDN
ncbi:phage portal protein [Streptomyces sp. TRM76323]|uniref:Phage portal protein n=1 Tax=Streptomyces tamarix TaxID=3078565 RepID=A0ABU3QKT7_9ACTN|nr:phage portal protein [Streptomyces tamarix]MDT9683371.1 phage portal protein [Streptomyces tamarix]